MQQNFIKHAIIKTVFVILILTLAAGLQHCSTPEHSADHSGQTHGHNEDRHQEMVSLSDAQLDELGIELGAAAAGSIETHVDLTGEIEIDPGRLAHIMPRFPGIVQEVRKSIGDEVNQGEVLALIESNESLTTYPVKSLLKGTVIDMHLTAGEAVTDETHAFTVANLDEVWVHLNVYQKFLPEIHPGQTAVIKAGASVEEAAGIISYVSPVVNEATRTAVARVVLANPGRQWRPGLFVSARITTGKTAADIVVPKTALFSYQDRTVVFVKEPAGFHPRPVETGRRNDSQVEIRRGLTAGEIYAAKGGFILKAELRKESFGGHAH